MKVLCKPERCSGMCTPERCSGTASRNSVPGYLCCENNHSNTAGL